MSSHDHLGVVIGHNGERLYGFDAELFLKLEAKRDRKWERSVLEWVQEVLGEPLPDLNDIWLCLKSGVMLCKLINKIKPDTIPKYSTTRLVALVERDNIDLFLQACWKFGVPPSDMFNSSDLYTKKAILQVYQCLASLATIAPRLGWKGVQFKPAPAEKPAPAKKWDAVATGPKMVHADDLAKGPEKKLVEIQLELAESQKELQTLRAKEMNNKEETEGLRKEIQKLKESMRSMKREGGAASAADVGNDDSVRELESRLAALEKEKATLQKEKQELLKGETKMREFETKLSTLSKDKETLTKQKADLEAQLRSLKDKAEAANNSSQEKAAAAVAAASAPMTAVGAVSLANPIEDPNFKALPVRDQLLAFYTMYNPTKIADVDKALATFAGREDKMFALLAHKYKDQIAGVSALNGAGAALSQAAAATQSHEEEIKRIKKELEDKDQELRKTCQELEQSNSTAASAVAEARAASAAVAAAGSANAIAGETQELKGKLEKLESEYKTKLERMENDFKRKLDAEVAKVKREAAAAAPAAPAATATAPSNNKEKDSLKLDIVVSPEPRKSVSEREPRKSFTPAPSADLAGRRASVAAPHEDGDHGYEEFRSGAEGASSFYSSVPVDVLRKTEGLLTNVLVGMAVPEETITSLRALVRTENGPRAFTYVLEMVLEKVYFANGLSASFSALGESFKKYGRHGKPHERMIKVDKKQGLLDWGSNHIKIAKIQDVKKGKNTAVFDRYPDVDADLCLSVISADRTLDLQASSKMQRDSFYWSLMGVWDKFQLESKAIMVSPLVIPSEACYNTVVDLLNLALMEVIYDGRCHDFQTTAVMMQAAERICCKVNPTTFKFAQQDVLANFKSLPSSFWEEFFWRQQTKANRDQTTIEVDNRPSALNANSPLSPAPPTSPVEEEIEALKMEAWITEKIMVFSPCLWEWGLSSYGCKEFMKCMHGSNALSDDILYELLKFVDALQPRIDLKDRVTMADKLSKQSSKRMQARIKSHGKKTPAAVGVVVPASPRKKMDSIAFSEPGIPGFQGTEDPAPHLAPIVQGDDEENDDEKGESHSQGHSRQNSPTASSEINMPHSTSGINNASAHKETEKERKEREKKEKEAQKEREKKEKKEREEKEKREKEEKKQEEERKKQEAKKSHKGNEKKVDPEKKRLHNEGILLALREGKPHPDLPKDIDSAAKEGALGDELFAEVFQMSKKEFAQLPPWKQLELRKKYDLF